MRNIKLVILIISTLLMSCENSKTENIYNQTLKEAEKQQKYVLLDFTAIWCGGCKAYNKYIFNDSRLTYKKITDKFIILKIDRDKPENKYLVNKYKISGLPHIVLIDNNELIMGSVSGFDKKYVSNPELFISNLDRITESQGKIRKLEEIFLSDTTNDKIIEDLLKKYQNIGQYIGVKKIKKLLIEMNPTPKRLFEYNFNQAIYSIKSEMNPNPLITILSENDSLNEEQIWTAYSKLLYYYESINDTINQDCYYHKLLEINPGYMEMKYARFLFEHNLKIDSAIVLTKKLLLNENIKNDHWGQFLKAHSLVYQGKKTQAVDEYYDWMEKNKNRWQSGETYWPLYFYASFANYHNIDLERALDYIIIAEEKRNMVGEKLLMAEILYKLGKFKYSINKLTEALKHTNDKNEYDKIMGLIEKYEKE